MPLEKIESVESEIDEALEEGRRLIEKKPISFAEVLSTGSTQLDMDISGLRTKQGGIPGGIMVEVSGLEGTGKTAMLAEVASSTQHAKKKGDIWFSDPEGRLDEEYAQIYGMKLDPKKYDRPDTVEEMFDNYETWQPNPKAYPGISVFGADSLAALSTKMEMKDEDKMGMMRAKQFSQSLRKFCRRMADPHRLFLATNQVREGTHGYKTTGGLAVRYYSSLRIQFSLGYPTYRIERTRKMPGSDVEIKKTIGIVVDYRIIKSSIDENYRSGTLYIIFNYGIDRTQGDLQYIKELRDTKGYDGDGLIKPCNSMDLAIQRIEDDKLEDKLREKAVAIWHQVQEQFETDRRPKKRQP